MAAFSYLIQAGINQDKTQEFDIIYNLLYNITFSQDIYTLFINLAKQDKVYNGPRNILPNENK